MTEKSASVFDCPDFANGKYCSALCSFRHLSAEEKSAIVEYRSLQESSGGKKRNKLGPVFIIAGMERSGTSWLYNAIRLLLLRDHSPWGPADCYRLNHITKSDIETRLTEADGRPLVIRTMRIPDSDWNENLDRVCNGQSVFVAHRDLRDVIDNCLAIGWMKHDLNQIITRLKSYTDAFEYWKAIAIGDFRYEDVIQNPVDQLKHLARLMNVSSDHSEKISKEIISLRPGMAVGPDQVTKMAPIQRVVSTHGDNGELEQTILVIPETVAKLSDIERKKIRDSFESFHDRYGYV